MRIVVAIEPRYYREVIGSAIQGLKPHLEVTVVEPDELEEVLERLEPDLVLCEHAASAMAVSRSDPSSWIEYRPFEETPTKISVGGRYRELEEFELTDLLSVVDEVQQLSRARRNPPNS